MTLISKITHSSLRREIKSTDFCFNVFKTRFASRDAASVAYSLVEILVILGIIAALAVLLLPMLFRAQQKAQSAMCVSNLIKMGQGIALFAGEHDGHLPPYKNVVSTPSGGYSEQWWYSSQNQWLYQYIDDNPTTLKKIIRCPSDKTARGSAVATYCSYAVTSDYLLYWGDGAPPPAGPGFRKSRYVNLGEAARKILMLDGTDLSEGYGINTAVTYAEHLLSDINGATAISSRHNNGVNCLFGDGSVQWMSRNELLADPVNTPASLYTRPYP